MKQAAQELHPNEKIRNYTTPSRYVAPTYGKNETAPMQSSAAPTTAAETKYIQKVHGKLLYYAMQADPSKGIANDEITLRKSKAFHTRYHWIRDRVRQGQYKVVHLEGTKLLADFFTKPQPPIKQKYFASQLTVPTN